MLGESIWKVAIMSLDSFIGSRWTDEQIREAARLAYAESYWLRMPEFQLFIRKVKAGKIRSHKNFSPVVFMEMLTDYCTEIHHERGNVLAYAWKNEKNDFKAHSSPYKLDCDKIHGKGRDVAKLILQNSAMCQFLQVGATFRRVLWENYSLKRSIDTLVQAYTLKPEKVSEMSAEKQDKIRRVNELRIKILQLQKRLQNKLLPEDKALEVPSKIAELRKQIQAIENEQL